VNSLVCALQQLLAVADGLRDAVCHISKSGVQCDQLATAELSWQDLRRTT